MNKINFLYGLLFLLIPCFTQGQIQISPLKKHGAAAKIKKDGRAKTEATLLELPFWDDFSTDTGFPKDSIWESGPDGFNVEINPGIGLNAPTVNVASFNGSRGDGLPYSLGIFDEGPTDTLTSQAIDLSSYTAGDAIYLSFYYQYTGNGNEPNDSDSFILDFLKDDGVWDLAVWDTLGLNNSREDTFAIVLRPVMESKYLHDNFKFRFRAEGRQSGPYDTWNLDYIYLNVLRDGNDTYSPDKGLTNQVTSPFADYTGIPYQHFLKRPMGLNLFDFLEFDVYNLDSETIFGVKATLEYINTAYTAGTGVTTKHLLEELGGPSASGVKSRELRHVTGIELLDEGTFDTNADSLDIEIRISLTEDNPNNYLPHFAPLDFSVNDSVGYHLRLSNYYAYDDGTAEWGAGVTGEGSFVAQKFAVIGGDEADQHMVGIDVYFPYIGTNSVGKRINLMVWDSDNGFPGEVLYTLQTNVEQTSQLNEFRRYLFDWTVVPVDTFFIGLQQFTTDRISIGADRNFDNGDKMYYNLNGTWLQNSFVKGSLMIRPVFGEEISSVTGLDPATKAAHPYPNPTKGMIHLPNKVEKVVVMDALGQQISVPIVYEQQGATVQLSGYPNGLYIIQTRNKKQTRSFKITLNQ